MDPNQFQENSLVTQKKHQEHFDKSICNSYSTLDIHFLQNLKTDFYQDVGHTMM